MSNQTTNKMVVVGRTVLVVVRTEPYYKVNVICDAEEATVVESTIYYRTKGTEQVVTQEELRSIAPVLAYTLRNYTK